MKKTTEKLRTKNQRMFMFQNCLWAIVLCIISILQIFLRIVMGAEMYDNFAEMGMDAYLSFAGFIVLSQLLGKKRLNKKSIMICYA